MAKRCNKDTAANDETDDETEHDGENEETEDELANNQKKYPCLHRGCPKRYCTMPSRSNHMKKCTLPLKSPKKGVQLKERADKTCKFCPSIFKHISSLYIHQDSCNTARLSAGKQPIAAEIPKQKEFICETCFTKFTEPKSWKNTRRNIQGKISSHVTAVAKISSGLTFITNILKGVMVQKDRK